MEPQVKYAKTSDGVNIAYYTLGSGPPFIWLIAPGSHILVERKVPRLRAALEGVERFFTLVRMDLRGTGLSDREVTGFSLDGFARDIEAVIDKEKLERAAMVGVALATYPAVHYAAAHPDKVSHLILLDPPAPGRRNPRIEALQHLAQVDWELASATIMRSFYGRDVDESGEAELFKQGIDPSGLRSWGEASKDWDIKPALESLQMPVLVIYDRNNRNVSPEEIRRTVAVIPDGRFVEVENAYEAPAAAARFLAGTGGAPPAMDALAPRQPVDAAPVAVILFADIVDSTGLTERLGDAAFRDKARELDGALRSVIREHAGTPIEGKLLGDGVLAVFASARQAIEAALACGKAGEAAGLPLHLGLHAGDVIREDDNVYGGAVNIAARISAVSAPGEVLVSETVRSLARTSAGVSFEDRGEQALKGVGEAVRVWAVREGEA